MAQTARHVESTVVKRRSAGRLLRMFSRGERRCLAGMAAVIAGLHIIGWATLAVVVGSGHAGGGGRSLGLGIGVTAYALGMRHAFDADHIAAIDNTTRKLMGQRERPLSVGFWFSLGHSSIVFGLTFLLSVGLASLVGPLQSDSSRLHRVAGMVGTVVSGTFLYAIAAVNLAALVGVWRVWKRLREGSFDERALEEHLAGRGLMNRLLGRVTKAIDRPWQMYPVGLLFGLGFDTASEVALLVMAASSTATGLPWYAVLCLPVLFAAGMSLLDTVDGSFMNMAYGWAFSHPVRKVYYNLTVTGLSVTVALVVGTAELLSLLADRLALTGGFWGWVRALDLNTVGFAVVFLFVAVWGGALLVWRMGRIGKRLTAAVPGVAEAPSEAAV